VDKWNGREPTLADIRDEFPGWGTWRDTAGLCYARLAGGASERQAQVKGEDPRDLRDSILRWIGLHEDDDQAPEAGS
jgi:hypothetical protein